MELANIERLLEKYLNAETSIAEEQILKDYFTGNNVAPHLGEYEALFCYFSASKNERFTKSIQLKSQKSSWKWLSIAASVVLLVSVYTGYERKQEAKAEALFQETQMAFGLLSQNLNKGTVAIGQLDQIQKTTNKIFKQPEK